ncbi:hypothetical protein MTR_4g024595 [Medicago truncatula]|uniref:Uncharacterized protein n=1 Tax=Medicago truncatula TaxID=3880 RepID=A0A072UH56_MEDTR|nr:hypothetical protein MTR_4g024595 [Medicago truncatula]
MEDSLYINRNIQTQLLSRFFYGQNIPACKPAVPGGKGAWCHRTDSKTLVIATWIVIELCT